MIIQKEVILSFALFFKGMPEPYSVLYQFVQPIQFSAIILKNLVPMSKTELRLVT